MQKEKTRYGQELGPNLMKVAKRLIDNQDLLKLLMNTDLDPLNPQTHPDTIDGLSLLNKNIRVIPLITTEDTESTSKIVVSFIEGEITSDNYDNENTAMLINIYCPFKEWLIAGDTIRPFAIMSEVRKSLQDVRINGLGEIRYEGYGLSTLTDEMGSYSMRFYINAFS